VAGSPTALLLARKGYRVLLLERAQLPQDTISTHLIHLPGVARLARWGLLDRLIAGGCPPINTFRFDFGPFAIEGSPGPYDGLEASYAPRRLVLDDLLLRAAAEAGAEVRQGFTVQELIWDGDRVCGIRGRTAEGKSVTERAALVIGADGRHSLVAEAVGAPIYELRPPLTLCYYAYWSGVPMWNRFDAYLRDRRAVIALPTHAGQTLIGVQWPHAGFRAFRGNVRENFLQTLEVHAPELAERAEAGVRESRFMGTADLPNYFRTPFGPGWALVGDAGYHRDPTLGHGISDAFRDAELLAAAIDQALGAGADELAALEAYQRQRDHALAEIFDLTCRLAAFPAVPDFIELQKQLSAAIDEQSAALASRPVPGECLLLPACC
jgi:2-polyprenyl-6-methoxyphenol hydroxylase-like FAD-dependent oxidoreductase